MTFDEAIKEAQKAFANEMQRSLSSETERFRTLCAITGYDPEETTYAEVLQVVSKHHKVDHAAEEARERLIEILPVDDDASWESIVREVTGLSISPDSLGVLLGKLREALDLTDDATWDTIVREVEKNSLRLQASKRARQELCDFLGFAPGTHPWEHIIRNIKMTCASSSTAHDGPASDDDELDLTLILQHMKDRYTDQTADFVRCCNLRCQSGAKSALARAIRAEVVQLLLELDGWPPKKERG